MTAKNAAQLPDALPVRDGEDPWTSEEISELHEELCEELARMEQRVAAQDQQLNALLQDGTEGTGRDPADVGSINFERDQELSIAANARELADQVRLALQRFEEGKYGLCEVCGNPIGKGRLQVFPRATLCVTCKQREERR